MFWKAMTKSSWSVVWRDEKEFSSELISVGFSSQSILWRFSVFLRTLTLISCSYAILLHPKPRSIEILGKILIYFSLNFNTFYKTRLAIVMFCRKLCQKAENFLEGFVLVEFIFTVKYLCWAHVKVFFFFEQNPLTQTLVQIFIKK